jgi:hypothetical protein
VRTRLAGRADTALSAKHHKELGSSAWVTPPPYEPDAMPACCFKKSHRSSRLANFLSSRVRALFSDTRQTDLFPLRTRHKRKWGVLFDHDGSLALGPRDALLTLLVDEPPWGYPADERPTRIRVERCCCVPMGRAGWSPGPCPDFVWGNENRSRDQSAPVALVPPVEVCCHCVRKGKPNRAEIVTP